MPIRRQRKRKAQAVDDVTFERVENYVSLVLNPEQRQYLETKQRCKIRGDGNCMFAAFAKMSSLYGRALQHRQVRKAAVDFIRAHPDYYHNFYPGLAWPEDRKPSTPCVKTRLIQEYLDIICANKEWGNELTLQALSDKYGVNIILLNLNLKTIHSKVLPAAGRTKQSTSSQREVFLVYNGKDHYDALQDVDTRTTGKAVVECISEGGKIRARVISRGYDSTKNCQFPRTIRRAGRRFLVDTVVNGGSCYRVKGTIVPIETHRRNHQPDTITIDDSSIGMGIGPEGPEDRGIDVIESQEATVPILEAMGYGRCLCVAAVKHSKGDFDSALDWLSNATSRSTRGTSSLHQHTHTHSSAGGHQSTPIRKAHATSSSSKAPFSAENGNSVEAMSPCTSRRQLDFRSYGKFHRNSTDAGQQRSECDRITKRTKLKFGGIN